MTVSELIIELNKVEYKDASVFITDKNGSYFLVEETYIDGDKDFCVSSPIITE